MMNVPGIGVKKARLFFDKGIKNIAELKKAVLEHKLIGLPGFKEKSEQKILEGIKIYSRQRGRIPLKKAEKIAGRIIVELRKLKEVSKVIAAGSIRRKKLTIGDIDLVVETNSPEKVIGSFIKMDFVKEVLGKGKEKATIITKDNMQIDIRVFSPEEFGAGLLYFTGDKQHNIWLRKIAIKKGLKLNEYGLFKGKKRIAGKTEEEIYKKLGVKRIKPEKRIGKSD